MATTEHESELINVGGLKASLQKLKTDIIDGKVESSSVGAASGVASLDESGLVPSTQLPSYVDDVVDLLAITDTAPEHCAKGDLYFNTTTSKVVRATGTDTWGTSSATNTDPEKGKIYVNLYNDKTYRWSGSTMVATPSSDFTGIKVGSSGSTLTPSQGVITIPEYETGADVTDATNVKAALGTDSTHGGAFLRKDGTWQTPPNDNTTYGLSVGTGDDANKIVLTPSSGNADKITVPYASNAGTVNGKTVAENVPSGAKFTDTTYESKSAASGGTEESLVTTGEKYTWNSKQDALSFNQTPSSSNKVATMADIPSSLPANGGNADTVDGFHVSTPTRYTLDNFVYKHSRGINTQQDGTKYIKVFEGIGGPLTFYYFIDTDSAPSQALIEIDTFQWRVTSPSIVARRSTGYSMDRVQKVYVIKESQESGTYSVYLKVVGVTGNLNIQSTIDIPSSVNVSTTEPTVSSGDSVLDLTGSWSIASNLPFKGDITGNANYATTAGSAPANGGNSSTVNGHTVNSDVPAGAVFTDTNTWRPLGTGADDACAGNDSRLSDSRPASDVYSWAKQSTKPSYSYSEISGTPNSLPASDVYDWAKASTKPSYSYSEISNTPSSLPASDVSAWAKAATKPAYTLLEVGASMSVVAISADTSSVCGITGAGNSGKTETIIYTNSGSSDLTVTVPTTNIQTPDGQAIELTCLAGGYCEVNYINISGVIYARGI